MWISRRTFYSATLAATSPARAAEPALSDLVRRSEAANDALMRGEVNRYRALVPLTDDFLLMSPFGGSPSRGPADDAAWASLGRFFSKGALTQETVQTWVGADMAVLAVIERTRGVEVGGLPAQDWALRVTLVYRRTPEGWALAHRHADPLAHGVGLEQAAALGRGEEERP